MEQQGGKRVAPRSGMSGGAKAALAIVIVLAVLLAAGYVGLCTYVNGSTAYLPNTAIAGVDVSGMTADQAAAALEEQLPGRLSQLSVSFLCDGTEYTVLGSDLVFDGESAVQQAGADQHGNFLTGGARFLSALLGGADYPVSLALNRTPEAVAQAVAASSDPEAQTTWELIDSNLLFHKGRTGRTVDIEALTAALTERFNQLLDGSAPDGDLEAQVTTAPPAAPNFQAIYDELYIEATSAYLDPETKEIIPAVTGVSFDMAQAAAVLESTDEGSSCLVPLIIQEPPVTTEEFNQKLFADVLAQTSTVCATPASRIYNIKLACSFVNGTILMPDEVFSYTALCGPYSLSTGYQKAGAYVQGKTVDTTAGGICQLSSTLYWATLVANLETVERQPHAYNSTYMPIPGIDATVYGDSPDFKFKNSTDFPIKIECYVDSSNRLYVTLTGTDTTGIHGAPRYTLISSVAAGTVYEAKADQPLGTTSADPERTAYTGKTVDVYLDLIDKNGNVIETKFLHRDTYRMRNAVIFYNPADAAALGIDPATGLKTLTPVTPPPEDTTVPENTPGPEDTVPPETSSVPEETPAPEATDYPPLITPVNTPDPTPTPIPESSPSPGASGPGMEPEDVSPPAAANTEPPADGMFE